MSVNMYLQHPVHHSTPQTAGLYTIPLRACRWNSLSRPRDTQEASQILAKYGIQMRPTQPAYPSTTNPTKPNQACAVPLHPLTAFSIPVVHASLRHHRQTKNKKQKEKTSSTPNSLLTPSSPKPASAPFPKLYTTSL